MSLRIIFRAAPFRRWIRVYMMGDCANDKSPKHLGKKLPIRVPKPLDEEDVDEIDKLPAQPARLAAREPGARRLGPLRPRRLRRGAGTNAAADRGAVLPGQAAARHRQ